MGSAGGSLTDIAASDDLGARPKNRKWVLTIWYSPITYAMCPVVLEATYSLGMHISTSIGGLNRVSQKSLKHLPLSKGSNHGWHINQPQPTSGASMDISGWVKTCCLTNIHLHISTSRTPIIPLRFWRQLSHSFAVSPFRFFKRPPSDHHPTISSISISSIPHKWVCLKIGYIPNYSHFKTGLSDQQNQTGFFGV